MFADSIGDNKASKGAEQCVGRVNGRRAESVRPRTRLSGPVGQVLRGPPQRRTGRRNERRTIGNGTEENEGSRSYYGQRLPCSSVALVNARDIPSAPRPVSSWKQEILVSSFISFFGPLMSLTEQHVASTRFLRCFFDRFRLSLISYIDD